MDRKVVKVIAIIIVAAMIIISFFITAPAAKAGIQSGDVVIKIDGVSVTGQGVDQISQKLRGLIGTKVLVTVKRGTQEFNFTVTREIIKTTSVYTKMLENKTGYIQITNFDKDTDSEFEIALRETIGKGAASIICLLYTSD